MKKIISILAVLVLASSAMAAVTLDVNDVDCDNGWVKITYDKGAGVMPRAFSLKVEVSTGVIQDVDTSGCEPFNIYMGTIEIVGDQIQWNDPGYTPVAPPDAPDDPCQLGHVDGWIILEMGSLYDMSNPSDPNKPAASGDLIKIKVSDTTATMTVTSNALRGKVVLEDTTNEDSGVVKDLTDICDDCGCQGVCLGDMNNDGWLSPQDAWALIEDIETKPEWGYWIDCSIPAWNGCGDVTGDDWCSPQDVWKLIEFIELKPEWGYWIECGDPNIVYP